MGNSLGWCEDDPVCHPHPPFDQIDVWLASRHLEHSHVLSTIFGKCTCLNEKKPDKWGITEP